MIKLKIFLSSTYVDLADVREAILKFLGILKGELVSMEFFGSDESKPKDYCLDQVRGCNFFIGVYAERYGSIDPETGLSLTELEYREALKMMEEGRLKGLLVYLTDPDANWPIKLVDRDPLRTQKLSSLKDELSRRHTVTFFKSTEELPFLVLRDVIRKVGLGSVQVLRPKTRPQVRRKETLNRPVGMEFYSEELARLFKGRERETERLIRQLVDQRMNLLIGSSGVGKTSLLNAGLLPQLHQLGWRTAIVRPLTQPVENLRRALWGQFMEGPIPQEFDLPAVARAAATAHEPSQTLVIIDQFEDVLGVKATGELEQITQALIELYTSREPNLRILICYRGDVESLLGPVWQQISGSADGLPRLYLGPLSEAGGKEALLSNLEALGISVAGSNGEARSLTERIIEDLAGESLLAGYTGIYPPFLQMVISKIAAGGKYTGRTYDAAGTSRKIISDFLISQLKYLGRDEQKGREVLISLVSSYGTKTQKTADEIATETLHEQRDVERLLKVLVDLRLVRAIDGHHEIVHDFLAKTILNELVSADEREAKKYKDLIAARTAAFTDTGAALTLAEHLRIYKHRNKILCTEEEVKLLLDSHLIEGRPVHYWLRSYPKEKVIEWARSLASDVDGKEGAAAYERNADRLLLKVGVNLPLEELLTRFRGALHTDELKKLVSKQSSLRDISLLMKMTRSRSPEVKEVIAQPLIDLLTLDHEEELAELAGRSSQRRIFEAVALKLGREMKIAEPRAMWHAPEPWKRLFALYAISVKGTEKDLKWIREVLAEKRLTVALKAAAVRSALRLAYRLGKKGVVSKLLKSDDPRVASVASEAVEGPVPGMSCRQALAAYSPYNSLTSWRVRALASEKDLPALKRGLKQLDIGRWSGDLVLAVCDHGSEEEFDFLVELFLRQKEQIQFQDAPLVLEGIAGLAGRRHLSYLEKIISTEEFWGRYGEFESQHITVANDRNSYFIKWIVGVTYARLGGRQQIGVFRRLLNHPYWTVRNAAADALLRLCQVSDLHDLIDDALNAKGNHDAFLKVLSGLDERFYAAGLNK